MRLTLYRYTTVYNASTTWVHTPTTFSNRKYKYDISCIPLLLAVLFYVKGLLYRAPECLSSRLTLTDIWLALE